MIIKQPPFIRLMNQDLFYYFLKEKVRGKFAKYLNDWHKSPKLVVFKK